MMSFTINMFKILHFHIKIKKLYAILPYISCKHVTGRINIASMFRVQ